MAEAAGTLTGTVFRDYDADGVDDGAFEPGVPGVTVTAYDAAGMVAGTTSTCEATADPEPFCDLTTIGDYSLDVSGSGPYRLEFTGLPPWLEPGPVGGDSRTTVRFVDDPTGGTTSGLDLGVANPAQHCLPGAQIVVPCYVNGDPLATPGGACPDSGAPASDFDAFVAFPDTLDSADGTGVAHLADAADLGAVWGVAWQRESGSVFAAATIKRHSGLGPLPTGSTGSRTGVIYRLTGDFTTDDGATVEAWFNLDDIPGVDTGPEPTRDLEACTTEPNHDPNTFDAVGKLGLGDLDIGDDGETLWVVNLFDRTLYEMTIGDPPQAPSATDVVAHPFGAAEPTCTNGVFRPWALTVHDGRVYVGGVCTAENGGDAADLTLHVLRHDPDGAAGNFVQVFESGLDYPRGVASRQGTNAPDAEWRPWIDEWSDIVNPAPGSGPFGQTLYPQPMLTDITFDVDGSMILGFLDRAGAQLGNENYQTDTSDTTTFEGVASGELLRICFDPDDSNGDGNPFVRELDSDCPGPVGPTVPGGQTPSQGPGGAEFYWAEYYPWFTNQDAPNGGTHQEIALGGLSHRFGSGEIGTSAFDPYDNVRSGGVIFLGNTTGDRTHSVEVFGLDEGGQPATFGKAAGIGDLELLCERAPLQLGDRLWCDADEDGVQDGGEAPIPGVTVTLDCGDDPLTNVTDADGLYLFTDADYLAENGTPIPRGGSCTLSVDTAADAGPLGSACGGPNVIPTVPNAGEGVAPDLNDSDGIPTGAGPVEIVIVDVGEDGENDHSHDFGFVVGPPPGSIGDTVWCDGLEGTGNGTFDAGEGVAAVTVELFADADCDDVADGPAIDSQETTGDGQYLFDNLPTGPAGMPICYVVRVDATDADLGVCDAPITPIEFAPDLDETAPDDLDNDFGFVEPLGTGSIGDTVWCDGLEGTGNGSFDPGEGVAGVTVELFDDTDCDDTPDGPAIDSQETAGDGQYVFDDLPIGPPGDPVCYVVQVDETAPELGACDSPITPIETSPDLDFDEPDDLDNDFGFEILCMDPDGDRVCNESCTEDRDGDGRVDCEDYDPQGYFYCEDNGDILSGGSIDIVGPGAVTILEDGSTGRYSFVTDGTSGEYTLVITPPEGTRLSEACDDSGTFDPTGETSPVVLGGDEVLDSGVLSDATCDGNQFFLTLDLEDGDPIILSNNVPFTDCAFEVIEVPTASARGLLLLGLLLGLAGWVVLTRRR